MKKTFLLLVISLCLPLCYALGADVEIKREINKEFNVSEGSELEISNLYGHITIKTWDKQSVHFHIEITGKSNKEIIAQELADRVDVEFKQQGRELSAKTRFNQIDQRRCNNCSTTVNYTVNVPASILMELKNRFGNLYLDEVTTKFEADVEYGNIEADKLIGPENDIEIRFGNVTIDEASQLELDMQYGKAKVNKVTDWKLESRFSNFTVGEVGRFDIDTQYDNFKIELANTVKGEASFSNFTIQTLTERFDLTNIKYGKVKILKTTGRLKSIILNSSFTPVEVNLPANMVIQADLSAHFGKLRTNGLKFSDVELGDDDSYTKSIRGTASFNKSNPTAPSATMKIRTSYADITINKLE